MIRFPPFCPSKGEADLIFDFGGCRKGPPTGLKPRRKYPLNSSPKLGEVPAGPRGMTKADARTSERNGRVTRLA